MTIRTEYWVPGLHILTWLFVLLLPAIIFHNVDFDTGLPGNFFLITNMYHIALFYFNAYYLYPHFFTRKRWWLYIIVIGLVIVSSYQVKLLMLHWSDPFFEVSEINRRVIFFPVCAFLISSFFFRAIVDRIRSERAEKERKAERLSSELKFLRSQVSPHFLFNVLSNMVSLARKQSALLEPSLIQLSNLLRYMLYESDDHKFPLEKEIEYLKNYIELQHLRFGEDVAVQLNVRNNQPGCTIEPMLLIPFVENAFKHGIGMVPDPFIDIFLETKEGHLYFMVTNNYSEENLSKDKTSGIGLANVRNRLNLLYESRYDLSIRDTKEIYTVELKLDLTC